MSHPTPWLRWLHATATFVFIAALCLAVALLVIASVPGSSSPRRFRPAP